MTRELVNGGAIVKLNALVNTFVENVLLNANVLNSEMLIIKGT